MSAAVEPVAPVPRERVRARRFARGTTRDGMIAAVIALATLLASTALESPFRRMFETGGEFFVAVARTHLDRGLAFTKGQDWVRNSENPYDWRGADPDEARPYAHHPPGLGLSLAALFLVLGDSPPIARLATLAMHLAGVLLLVLTVRRFAEPRLPWAAFFTGVFAAAAPVSAFFGRHVCHEAWVVPPLLLAIAAYLPRIERDDGGTRREDAAICIGIAVATYYDWPGLYLPPLLFGLEILRGRLRGRLAVWLVATSLVVGGLLVAQILWATGSAGLASLADGASKRVSLGTYGLAIGAWAAKVGEFFRDDFTGAVLILTIATILAGSVLLFVRWLHASPALSNVSGAGEPMRPSGAPAVRTLDPMTVWIGLWLGLGIFHVIAFPSGSFVHPYWLFYLLPAVATAAGLATSWLWRRRAFVRCAAGRTLALFALFSFACESRATLNRWYDVARFSTGNPALDLPLPPRLESACKACIPAWRWPPLFGTEPETAQVDVLARHRHA